MALHRLLPQSLLNVLKEGVEVGVEPIDGQPCGQPFFVPAPGRLLFAESSLNSPLGPLYLRHGLELAWLWARMPDELETAGLLAAKVFAELLDFAAPAAGFTELKETFAPLRQEIPRITEAAWAALQGLQPALTLSSPAAVARLAELWPFAGTAEYLMLTGGGGRIRVNPATGRNLYANAIQPEPEVVSWSSCTASTISERGLATAEACRRRLLAEAIAGNSRVGLHREADLVRRVIVEQWDLDPSVEIVLASSGTDASLILSGLAGAIAPELPLHVVLTSPSETGRGIPRAVQGRHYSPIASSGAEVVEDTLVTDFPSAVGLSIVPLRAPDGTLLPSETVVEETARVIAEQAARGQVLLHLLDVSKTGLVAPSFAAVAALHQQYGLRLLIAVDACQARFGSAQMNAYLEAGAAVLVTGSKFYAGPPFSGALLLPPGWSQALHKAALPAGLGLYSACADWPGLLPYFAWEGNVGLVLRWSAAAAEMAAFAALPAARRRTLSADFEKAVHDELARDPRLVPLPLPPVVRPDPADWDAHPLIVTFMIRPDPASPRTLGMAELAAFHRGLREARELPGGVGQSRFHLGQAVEIGAGDGAVIGGLRIAVGSPFFTGAEPVEEASARLRHDLRALVTKAGALLDLLAQTGTLS